MRHYFRVSEGHKIVEAASAEQADWIHLEGPEDEQMRKVAAKFNFPLDYLDSTLDPDEVSRSENLDQDVPREPVLISLLYPLAEENAEGDIGYINRTLSIIMLPDLIVTCVRSNPKFLRDLINNELELITELKDEQAVMIEICWHISKAYVLASCDVRIDMERLQEKLRSSTRTEHLLRLADLDKSIIYLHTRILANKPIIKDMSQAAFIVTNRTRGEWLHDVQVEVHQSDTMSLQTKQMLQQLDTTYSSIIQNNLNVIMKVLTSVTIIITIPMIFAGIWGMNIQLPFMKHPQAFLYIGLLTLISMILAVYLLKRKDLL